VAQINWLRQNFRATNDINPYFLGSTKGIAFIYCMIQDFGRIKFWRIEFGKGFGG